MQSIRIKNRLVGPGHPIYFVAEMSANHNQDHARAIRLVEAAKRSGADAVKLQTYTPDTMTLNCAQDHFRLKGTLWDGMNLYDLYKQAYFPWEWHEDVKDAAEACGLDWFSSAFDESSVDFLERLDVPVFKVASSELIDIPLLKRIGRTGRPSILSTGMASLEEIREAVQTIKEAGCQEVALLKCSAVYPPAMRELNLRTIQDMQQMFDMPVGFSDHTMGHEAAVAAAALGVCIIEKHMTLRRADEGPDARFSMEPEEFHAMVKAVRSVEEALGGPRYGPTEGEEISRVYRRSLFVVSDIRKGDVFDLKNVKSIRPGHGLHPRYLESVIGRRAVCDITRATPLAWHMIEGEKPR